MAKQVFRKDKKQTKVLVKAGKVASKRAFSASKALGLTVSYIENGIVYIEDSNGNRIIQNTIENKVETPFEIKKGLILHAK